MKTSEFVSARRFQLNNFRNNKKRKMMKTDGKPQIDKKIARKFTKELICVQIGMTNNWTDRNSLDFL
jgi:hypothetical protein